MTAIYRNNFVFIADRYEEWQGGRCISSDDLDVTITAEVKDDKIHFELSTVGSLRILKSFDFEILDYYGSVQQTGYNICITHRISILSFLLYVISSIRMIILTMCVLL